MQGQENRGLVAVNKWAEHVGITPLTAWRFRNRGWINTVNIAGRVYITQDEINRFTQRAAAGEFAKQHKTPPPRFQSTLP